MSQSWVEAQTLHGDLVGPSKSGTGTGPWTWSSEASGVCYGWTLKHLCSCYLEVSSCDLTPPLGGTSEMVVGRIVGARVPRWVEARGEAEKLPASVPSQAARCC